MTLERTEITYCRICEALCGLEVHLRDGDITAVRPDREHPVSKGFACVKGTALGALHTDPARLSFPQKRTDAGFERIAYNEAIRDVGAVLKRLRREHGPRSVAIYTGNPTFFNFKSFFFAEQLVDALGTPNLFASHSIDCNNKFHVAQEMYGLPTAHPVVDLSHTRFLMVLGSNPAVSQMSFIQAPNALGRLKEIVARGGRVVLVDPRRTETARLVGEHLPIRPGTDAFLLLAMGHVIVSEGLVDQERVRRFASNFEAFRATVLEWPPARVASLTGIDAETIRSLARAYATADGGALYMSTGVNMGPFGSIAYWLVQGLNLVTGQLDRRGGLLQPKGPFDLLRFARWLGLGHKGRRTSDGRWHGVVDALPAGALAEEILQSGPDRIRALIVSSGNPILSVPGTAMREALRSLELLVCVDIYPSETAQLAHYLFPATDMLERSDFPITTSLNQETPVAQYTKAVVPPAFERKEEWEIFCDLALAAGAPWTRPTLCHIFGTVNRLLRRLGRGKLDPDVLLRALLAFGPVSMSRLEREPHGVLLPPAEPGSFLGKRVATPSGLVNLAPGSIRADLPRLDRVADELRARANGLVLIGRRDKRSHNSWMHSNPGIRQPDGNTVLVHPDDAREHGLVAGSFARIESVAGRGVLPVEVSDDVLRGVVVVPHGWGHDTHGGERARALGGFNINGIVPGGAPALEPVSGQAIMLGHPVRIERA